MSPFELAEPASLREAIALLGIENARPLSGGTALMLMMKAGVLRPATAGQPEASSSWTKSAPTASFASAR